MRPDMAKVLVERPRHGSSLPSRKKGYRKYVQSTGIEGLPRREPMLGAWRGEDRNFNEHLGPLRRFLRGSVGRPWNKVHQELCEHVSFDSPVQKHVLTHVFEYVERRVDIVGGQVLRRGRWGPRLLAPGEMYVCPKTGLLKAVRRSRRERPATRRHLSADRMLLFHDGHWWDVRVRKVPDDPSELWDVWLERPVARLTQEATNAAYGDHLFAISCRAISPREVRRLSRQHQTGSPGVSCRPGL
jgi:hypothetical protein